MARPLEPDIRTTVEMVPSEATVRSAMSPGIIAISGESTVAACAATMADRRTHAVLVIDPESRTPAGWVFHRDILGHMREDPFTTRALDVVSQEAAYIHPEETLEEAADRMIADDVTHLLVGHSPEAVPEGVISSWDLVAFYARRSPR